MNYQYIPKLSIVKEISENKLNTNMPSMRMEGINENPGVPSFTDTMSQLVTELDETVTAPDQVLQDAIMGNGADVHDVMIAVSKAEIGLNLATQVTTKVVQAYEKIMAIQV